MNPVLGALILSGESRMVSALKILEIVMKVIAEVKDINVLVVNEHDEVVFSYQAQEEKIEVNVTELIRSSAKLASLIETLK